MHRLFLSISFPGLRHLLRGPVPRVLRHRHLPQVQTLCWGGLHQGGHFQPGQPNVERFLQRIPTLWFRFDLVLSLFPSHLQCCACTKLSILTDPVFPPNLEISPHKPSFSRIFTFIIFQRIPFCPVCPAPSEEIRRKMQRTNETLRFRKEVSWFNWVYISAQKCGKMGGKIPPKYFNSSCKTLLPRN